MKKQTVLAIAGGGVALALAVAIAISLANSESAAAARVEVGTVTISGQPMPALTPGTADPAVGTPIPGVSGTDFTGTPTAIDSGPAAIVFLAHWCPHCQAEVQEMVAFSAGGGDLGIPVLSVATAIDANRPNYPPWSWLEREGWTHPIVVDDAEQSVMRAFGGTGFPFWVFVDGDGNVVARASGQLGTETLVSLAALALDSA